MALPVGVDDAVDDGDDLLGHAEGVDQRVEPAEHHRWRRVDQRVGPHRRAHLTHHDGRRHALAHHVAEGNHDPAVGERHDVVPVAAHVDTRAAGLVVRTHREVGELGDGLGHQAALQQLGGRLLHLELQRPLHRLRHLGGERAEKSLLVRVEVTVDAEAEQQPADRLEPTDIGSAAMARVPSISCRSSMCG